MKLNEETDAAQIEPMDPLMNVLFLKLFGSQESAELTSELVNCILCRVGLDPIDPADVRIEADCSVQGGTVVAKAPRLDIKIVVPSRVIDLESQRQKGNIEDRMLHYGASLVLEGTPKGTSYRQMRESIVIVLYDAAEELMEGEGYLHRCSLTWDDTGEVMSGKLVFVLVEMNKFRRTHPALTSDILGDELESFLYYMVKGYANREERHTMENIYQSLEAFARYYDLAIDDPETAKLYKYAYESEADYQTGLDVAREEGLAKGLAEGEARGEARGRVEEREFLLKKLLAAGVSQELLDAALA